MEATEMQQEPRETTEFTDRGTSFEEVSPVQSAGNPSPEPPLPPEESGGGEEMRGVKKALRDTKAWATRLSQENAALKHALGSSPAGPGNAEGTAALAAEQLARTRRALERYEEFGPLLELAETMVAQATHYEREMAHQALLEAVLADHPDALDLKRDDEFLTWVDRQPPVVKLCLHHSEHPADVSWALELFKRERGEAAYREARGAAEAARSARMRHAATPTACGPAPSGAARFTRGDIARMSVEEYRKNEAAINDALTRGEIA